MSDNDETVTVRITMDQERWRRLRRAARGVSANPPRERAFNIDVDLPESEPGAGDRSDPTLADTDPTLDVISSRLTPLVRAKYNA